MSVPSQLEVEEKLFKKIRDLEAEVFALKKKVCAENVLEEEMQRLRKSENDLQRDTSVLRKNVQELQNHNRGLAEKIKGFVSKVTQSSVLEKEVERLTNTVEGMREENGQLRGKLQTQTEGKELETVAKALQTQNNELKTKLQVGQQQVVDTYTKNLELIQQIQTLSCQRAECDKIILRERETYGQLQIRIADERVRFAQMQRQLQDGCLGCKERKSQQAEMEKEITAMVQGTQMELYERFRRLMVQKLEKLKEIYERMLRAPHATDWAISNEIKVLIEQFWRSEQPGVSELANQCWNKNGKLYAFENLPPLNIGEFDCSVLSQTESYENVACASLQGSGPSVSSKTSDSASSFNENDRPMSIASDGSLRGDFHTLFAALVEEENMKQPTRIQLREIANRIKNERRDDIYSGSYTGPNFDMHRMVNLALQHWREILEEDEIEDIEEL